MAGFNLGIGIEALRDEERRFEYINLQPNNKIGLGKDIRRSNRWSVDTLVGLSTLSLGRNFKLYAKRVKLPELSFEEEIFKSAGAEYKFVSLPKFSEATVEFYDVVGVYEQLHEQRNKMWTPQEGIRPASNYKEKTIFVLETSAGGGDFLKFILEGSYIKNLTHSDLTYEKHELKYVTLTLSYDYFTIEKAFNTCSTTVSILSEEQRRRLTERQVDPP